MSKEKEEYGLPQAKIDTLRSLLAESSCKGPNVITRLKLKRALLNISSLHRKSLLALGFNTMRSRQYHQNQRAFAVKMLARTLVSCETKCKRVGFDLVKR